MKAESPKPDKPKARSGGCVSGLHLLAVGALVLGASVSCVRRTVTVKTDPQGAAVILNDQNIGTSPASVDFTWYGDYSVILKKDGYETLTTHQRLNPPWYQIPPIDFVAEALMPFTIHDQQEMSFTLEPRRPVDRPALIEQAREFRDRALHEGVTTAATRPADAQTRPAG